MSSKIFKLYAYNYFSKFVKSLSCGQLFINNYNNTSIQKKKFKLIKFKIYIHTHIYLSQKYVKELS